jgi:hypothetical protein
VELLREFSKLRSDTYNRSNKLIIDVSSLERCSFAMVRVHSTCFVLIWP